MKKGFVFSLLSVVWGSAVLALTPILPANRFTLAWDYPREAVGPGLYFNLYSSTSIITPPGAWTLVKSLDAMDTNALFSEEVGTNTMFYLSNNIASASSVFFFVTATNFYGESLPSNSVTSPPALMAIGSNSFQIHAEH